MICYNGAVIRRAGQPPLYSASLSVGLMKRIAFFCRERGLYLQMYDEDHIVVDKICESTLIDPDSKVTGIREIGDLTKAELRPSPKMMILDDPKRIPAIRRDLETLLGDQLYMAKSKEYLLEMMPKDVSKQKALIRFAQSLEIRREEVMACGDNTNDIEMLEWAGLGVAMGNATDDIKEIADATTDDNNHDGVAKAIEKYAL